MNVLTVSPQKKRTNWFLPQIFKNTERTSSDGFDFNQVPALLFILTNTITVFNPVLVNPMYKLPPIFEPKN